MNTRPHTATAAQFGQEDANAGVDMQGSRYFIIESPEWLAYTAAYQQAAPKKRLVAIGRRANGQPFRVIAEG